VRRAWAWVLPVLLPVAVVSYPAVVSGNNDTVTPAMKNVSLVTKHKSGSRAQHSATRSSRTVAPRSTSSSTPKVPTPTSLPLTGATTTTTTTTAPPSPPSWVDPVTPAERVAWSRVGQCEEAGRNDPRFGYFGITPSSWASYGGAQFGAEAGEATYDQQVMIAERIQHDPPDQDGCGGGW
jgi:hypothetical protein